MDRMNPEHEARLKQALGLNAIVFMRDPKKELDNARVLRYWKALEDHDIEDVVAACALHEKRGKKFPLPADLLERVEAIVAKRGGPYRGPVQAPGAVPWCEVCLDSGTVFEAAPARQKRDIDPDDPSGDQVYTWARKCECREQNPVYRYKQQQNKAGVIRREEKAENNWSPNRRGQLVPFRR